MYVYCEVKRTCQSAAAEIFLCHQDPFVCRSSTHPELPMLELWSLKKCLEFVAGMELKKKKDEYNAYDDQNTKSK